MVGGYRFFPERAPGPVDDGYRQVRWVRPYRPGPFRWAAAVALLVLLFWGGLVAFALLTGATSIEDLGLRAVLAGLIYVGLAVLAARCFLAGVWVTDDAVQVRRLLSTRTWPWSEVADVRVLTGTAPLLGTPVRVSGRVSALVLSNGSDIVTPVGSGSPDFLGRAEAFTMAAEAVEGWFEQARRRRAP